MAAGIGIPQSSQFGWFKKGRVSAQLRQSGLPFGFATHFSHSTHVWGKIRAREMIFRVFRTTIIVRSWFQDYESLRSPLFVLRHLVFGIRYSFLYSFPCSSSSWHLMQCRAQGTALIRLIPMGSSQFSHSPKVPSSIRLRASSII